MIKILIDGTEILGYDRIREYFGLESGSLLVTSEFLMDFSIYLGNYCIRTPDATSEEIAEWHEAMKWLDTFDFDEARKRVKFLERY